MNEQERTRTSRFLSLVLRHQPAAAGLTLDEGGWVEVDRLLRGCAESGHSLSRSELEEVVETSSKRRFAISDDGRRIRASQGHSIEVELGYEPAEPPELLFHGTVHHRLPAIRAEGLRRMERHHVHLSQDEETARIVGARRGTAVLLTIDARRMRTEGHTFFRTPNGVWLTDAVPPSFIKGVEMDDGDPD